MKKINIDYSITDKEKIDVSNEDCLCPNCLISKYPNVNNWDAPDYVTPIGKFWNNNR